MTYEFYDDFAKEQGYKNWEELWIMYTGNKPGQQNVLIQCLLWSNAKLIQEIKKSRLPEYDNVDPTKVNLKLEHLRVTAKFIEKALVLNKYHKGKTAKMLGIEERTFYFKVKACKKAGFLKQGI